MIKLYCMMGIFSYCGTNISKVSAINLNGFLNIGLKHPRVPHR